MFDKIHNFTLLYQASRDGYNVEAFNSKTNGIAKTIMIIKAEGDLSYVFGGYTDIAWEAIPDRYAYK